MEEMEQTPSDGPIVADNRPLSDRIGDKNWKTRLTAYEDLKREIKNAFADDEIFSEYGPWLIKMTADSNASALDMGLDTALQYADVAPTNSMRSFTERICANVIDKALGATKASTVTKGKALVIKLMEVDDPTVCTTVLLSKLSDKKPKVPPACLEIMKEGLGLFGARAFPVKDIIAALGPVFGGNNGPAREIAMTYMVDLSRWIGRPPFNALLESIKPVQKADFDRMAAERESEPSPTPSLWLRKDRPKPGAEANVIVKAAAIDTREFIEEIDLTKKLKGTDYSSLVVEEKWSEQLKALQIVIDALGPNPKLKTGSDVADVLAVCKGFLRQGHVQLQVSSLRILTLLADGMRSEFSSIIRPLLEPIIMKVKEKRLIPEVNNCLMTTVKFCIPLDPMAEDLIEMIKNKKNPPHARVCILELLTSVVTELPEKVSTDSMRPIAEALVAVCEDSDPKVRDGCALALAAFAPVIRGRGRAAGDAHRTLTALEQSAPRVYKKMQTALESSPLAATTAQSSAAPQTSMTTATQNKKTTSTASNLKPSQIPIDSSVDALENIAASANIDGLKSQKLAVAKKSTTAKPTSIAPAATAKKTSSSSASATTHKKSSGPADKDKEDDKEDDLVMTLDESMNELAAVGIPGWDDSVQKNMDSAKWQDKVEALTVIGRTIVEKRVGGQVSAPLVMYLQSKTAGFKINNISILKGVIQLACETAQALGEAKFNRSAAWELIKAFGDKLSDKKTKDLVCTLLTALAEAVGPGFVIKRMKSVLDKTKAPLAHQYYLEWLKAALSEFGVGMFPVPFIGNFCQLEMENKVAAVRTAAVEVMGAMYFQIGPRLQSVAVSDDMKPALKALLEAEFQKVGYDPTAIAKPLRVVKGETGAGSGSESAIPRVDVGSIVDKAMHTELNLVEGKNSWQNRKVALEAIISACERSGHYLDAGKSGPELMKSLKARMNDTQANLKPIAASAIGHIIASLDIEQGAKMLKIVASGLLGGLGDNKKGMRDSTVAAMQMAVTLARDGVPGDATLLGVLVAPVGEALMNPVGRQELLVWFLTHCETLRAEKGDFTELATSLVAALQDKNAAVRSLAEQVLTQLLARALITRASLEKASRDLPPAVKRSLQGPLDRMMGVYGTKRAAPAVTEKEHNIEIEVEDNPGSPVRSSGSGSLQSRLPVGGAASNRMPAQLSSTTGALPSRKNVSAPQSLELPPTTTDDDVAVQAQSGDSKWLLRKTNKAKRLDELYKLCWPQPPEEPGEIELNSLRGIWEPLLAPELASLVFPSSKPGVLLNQDLIIPAITELTNQLDGQYAMQHTDMLCRYGCICLCLRETASGLLKILNFLVALFVHMHAEGSQLHEGEVTILLPHLIEKSGHKSERHRLALKQVLLTAGEVLAPNRLCAVLLQGLNCKNKKSRVVCLEVIQRVVEGAGAGALGRSGTREVGAYLESMDSDPQGRNACLELVAVLHSSLNYDINKLIKLLGAEKSVSMIDERIRQRAKAAPPPTATSSAVSKSLTSLPPPPPLHEDHRMRTSLIASVSHTSSQPHTVDASKILRGGRQLSPPPAGDPLPPAAFSPPRNPSSQSNHCYEGGTPSPFKLEELSPAYSNRIAAHGHTAGVGNSSGSNSYSTRDRDLGLPRPMAVTASATSSGSHTGASTGFTSNLSLESFKAESMTRDEHLEGIFLDIVYKIDALLSCRGPLREDDRINEECKDYLKLMLSVVAGEWSTSLQPEEDDKTLSSQAIPLLQRCLRCVERGFTNPSTPVNPLPPGSLAIDVLLLSISIANLFGLIKRRPVIEALNESLLAELISECLRRAYDKRLYDTALNETDRGNANQIVSALLLCVSRACKDAPAGIALCALMEVLFGCIQEGGDRSPLPVECTKAVVRSMMKVVDEEIKKPLPFTQPAVDIKKLLLSIHNFWKRHPINAINISEENYVESGAKTLLAKIVHTVGGQTVLSAFLTIDVMPSTFTFRMAARLAGISIPDNVGGVSGSAASGIGLSRGVVSTELHERIGALIDQITSSRDKMIPIRELFALSKAHKELDVNAYLQKISAAFRKFVLDTFLKLESEAERNASAENSINSVSSVANHRISIGGSSALKLIEDMKRTQIKSHRTGHTSQPLTGSMDVGSILQLDQSSESVPDRQQQSMDTSSNRRGSIISQSRPATAEAVRGQLDLIQTALSLPQANKKDFSEEFMNRFHRLRNTVGDANNQK